MNIQKQHNLIRAVLLTKSGKFGGACVAGYDLEKKQFVRFVSNAATGAEIPFSAIKGLSEFDIVEVEGIESCPLGPQSENVLVRPHEICWIGRYSGTLDEIRNNLQYPDNNSILGDTKNRLLDASGFRHSLELVPVQDLVLKKMKRYDGQETTRASFLYRGRRYIDFRVTDFTYDLRKLEKNTLLFPHSDLILSLPKEPYIVGEENKGFYKFVAAIFPKEKDAEEALCSFPAKEQNKQTSARAEETKNRNKSYEPWTNSEDQELIVEFERGMSTRSMAEKHERSENAIRSRLKKLGRIK